MPKAGSCSLQSMFPIMCIAERVQTRRELKVSEIERERNRENGTTGKLDQLVHSLLILVNISARANACLTTLAWLSSAQQWLYVELRTEHSLVRLLACLCVRSRYRIASARAYRMRGCVLRCCYCFYIQSTMHILHCTTFCFIDFILLTGLTKYTTFLS